MIGPHEVNLGEDVAAGECGGKIFHVRYGKPVGGGSTVQCPVVSTRTPVSRCLL